MFIYNDGGREGSGFKGKTDCGIRAIAIACEVEYNDARKLLKEFAKKGKQGNAQISKGIYKEDMDAALMALGWRWISAPKILGRKARYYDLPERGIYIVRMAHHFAAVVDGNLQDVWDSSNKMVYGYWGEDLA